VRSPPTRRRRSTARPARDGRTGLLLGGLVSKAGPIIETCGTLDEAVAALGLGRAILEDHSLQEIVLNLQRGLFR